MNQETEKIVYIEVEKIIYMKRPIPSYQKRAYKKYITSEAGKIKNREIQKAYYYRQKELKRSSEGKENAQQEQ